MSNLTYINFFMDTRFFYLCFFLSFFFDLIPSRDPFFDRFCSFFFKHSSFDAHQFTMHALRKRIHRRALKEEIAGGILAGEEKVNQRNIYINRLLSYIYIYTVQLKSYIYVQTSSLELFFYFFFYFSFLLFFSSFFFYFFFLLFNTKHRRDGHHYFVQYNMMN